MNRIILIIVALTFVPAAAYAQVSTRDERDFGRPGAMSVEQLRKEPITFELDISYADDSDRRHRLDLYLPKNRMSDRLPVIVFIHGGGWLIDDKHRTTRHQPQLYRENPGADT